MDNEINGVGNSINYKYRVHDPRIGRFLSIDPLTAQYPHNSPYAFSENRVVDGIELEGAEFKSVQTPSDPSTGTVARDNIQFTSVDENYVIQSFRDKEQEELINYMFNYDPGEIKAVNPIKNYINTMQEVHPVSFGSKQGGMGNGLARDPVIQQSAVGILTMGTANLIGSTSILGQTLIQGTYNSALDFGVGMSAAEGNIWERLSAQDKVNYIANYIPTKGYKLGGFVKYVGSPVLKSTIDWKGSEFYTAFGIGGQKDIYSTSTELGVRLFESSMKYQWSKYVKPLTPDYSIYNVGFDATSKSLRTITLKAGE